MCLFWVFPPSWSWEKQQHMSHLILQICSLFLPFPSASERNVSKYTLSFIIKINMGKLYINMYVFSPALAYTFNQILLGLTHFSLCPWVQTGSVFLKPSEWPMAMLILDLSVLSEEQFSTSVCFCWDIYNYHTKPLCAKHVRSLFSPAITATALKMTFLPVRALKEFITINTNVWRRFYTKSAT